MVRSSIAANILNTKIMSAASNAEALAAHDTAAAPSSEGDAEALAARDAAAAPSSEGESSGDASSEGESDGGVAAGPVLANVLALPRSPHGPDDVAARPALAAAGAGGGPPPPPPPAPPPGGVLALLPSPHRPGGEVMVMAQESWLDWSKSYRDQESRTSRVAARKMVDRFDQALTFADKLELMVKLAMNNPSLWLLVREEMQLDQKRKARQEQRKRAAEREGDRHEVERAYWRSRTEQLQMRRMLRNLAHG